ncbi:hypothetical protein [Nocardia farcinica]|uniref:hypothetical protein n=1 Tax=Nocardia farcinica TaxID=37329 RepID=UPI0018951A1F|nr:hypothetical protein [Nocardia farcinica]MBF6271615.1 hypothetical protein [Nocardia farcinica]
MAKVSRAGFDARKMKSKDLKGDRARLTATFYEAMRKTAGERAIEKYALENPAINPARTAENWDFVYDEATGDFREATSIEEVVDYAMNRRARLSKPVKGAPLDEAPSSMEGSGEVFSETFVIPVPWDLLEPIPGEYYHPLHRVTGLPLDGEGGRPLVRNQRFRIKEGKKEAFEAFKTAALDQIGKTLPGGKEAIFGGSLNLDEMRPHFQVIGDTFYATPTKRDPRALSNGFTKAFGRYPRYDVTVPEYRYHKRDAAGELMYGKDGSPVYASIGPARKMELHQRAFRERMHELGKQLEHDLGEGKGFHVEKDVDAQRHLRRLSAEDYKEVAQAQEAHDEDLLEFAEATQALDDETEARAIELSEAEAVARLERRADQRELARRTAAVEKVETAAIAARDEYLVAAVAEAQEIVAGAETQAAEITAAAEADAQRIRDEAREAEVERINEQWRRVRPQMVAKAKERGRAAGEAEAQKIVADAREQAVEIRITAETEARAKAAEIVEGAEVQADDIRATAVAEAAELERRRSAVDQREQQLDQREQRIKLDEREVAEGRAANEARAEELRGVADRLDLEYEALRAREAEYDPKRAVESMSVARYQVGEKLHVPVLQPDGTRVKRTFNEVLDEQAAKYKSAEAERTVGEMRKRGAEIMATLNRGRSNARAVDKQTGMQQKKGQYGPEMG